MHNEFYHHILQRLGTFGVTGTVDNYQLHLEFKGVSSKFRFDEKFEQSYRGFQNSPNSHFEEKDLFFCNEFEVEVPLVRLDNDLYREEETRFTDETGDEVLIRRASHNYVFAFFNSAEYIPFFERLVSGRLARRSEYPRSLNLLFRQPITATYRSQLPLSMQLLRSKGAERIRSCLVKVAIERHDCYEFGRPVSSKSFSDLDEPREMDDRIPHVVYDQNLVNYYKVGRASPFPSQSFLSYYHVLEYYFLRVAEDILHQRLRALLNAPSFQTSTDGLDKAISLVRKHVSNDDETEMLRKVLVKFVAEEDFIEYVDSLHALVGGEKIYSKRKELFGEHFELSLKEGHAISNAAKILKHIRNAIVHSSDKYSRDECHIPLTDSEGTIALYVPIVKFFAEKVLYTTASPAGS